MEFSNSGKIAGCTRSALRNLKQIIVFERRTSTCSARNTFLDCGFAQTFQQIVSIPVKTLCNTDLVASLKKDFAKAPYCM